MSARIETEVMADVETVSEALTQNQDAMFAFLRIVTKLGVAFEYIGELKGRLEVKQ